jgi:hypothetical protein
LLSLLETFPLSKGKSACRTKYTINHRFAILPSQKGSARRARGWTEKLPEKKPEYPMQNIQVKKRKNQKKHYICMNKKLKKIL